MVTLSFWDLLARLVFATVCGGLIGLDRGKKHHPAGFRTHILVCTGAALTIILGTYITAMLGSSLWNLFDGDMHTTDVSRFGAQVINGIGFLGAGTIIVTGRQQVKGMTTAAGLWASACMGLAIGAGFYMAALIGCAFIFITFSGFSRIETFIMSRTRNINIYVEFEDMSGLSKIIEKIKEQDVRIFDVELTKVKLGESGYPSAIFYLKLPPKKPHTAFITAVAEVDCVRSIEEL